MINSRVTSVIFISLWICLSSSALAASLRTFTSPSGFTVKFPSTLHQIGAPADQLDLVSSSGGAEGVVIRRDQAEIRVFMASDRFNGNITEIMNYYTSGAKVISREVLGGIHKSECRKILKIVAEEPTIPTQDSPIEVPNFVYTEFLCKVSNKVVVVVLKNYQFYPKQSYYQGIAREILMSISTFP